MKRELKSEMQCVVLVVANVEEIATTVKRVFTTEIPIPLQVIPMKTI